MCYIDFRNNAVKHVVYYPSLKVRLFHIVRHIDCWLPHVM